MIIKTSLTLAVVAASLVGLTSTSFAEDNRRGGHRFHVQDANTGETLFDDGKLDGKGCAVGSRAVFNPETGTFTKKPAVKCNF